jgi:hemerythrin-like domain-containing protein
MCSFLTLMELHEKLAEGFLRHQEALICLEFDRALELLTDYETGLLAHMRYEEARLIPVYQARAGRILGGLPEMFLGEHRKMREFLADFRRELGRIRHEDAAQARRSVIALMDRQAMYKHLVEHHDRREQNVLYPQLDRITSAEERAVLLEPSPGLAHPD